MTVEEFQDETGIELRCIRYHGRDVILWTMPDGSRQPFYKSTGRNSGKPGTWFPFEGWQGSHGVAPKFDKGLFVKKTGVIKRFGNHMFREQSNVIADLDLPEGDAVEFGHEVNEFLAMQGWKGR